MKLGVILKAHRRTDTLRTVFRELRHLRDQTGWELYVLAALDQEASQHVERVVSEEAHGLGQFIRLPFRVVSPAGEAFMRANNSALRFVRRQEPDWIYMQDDDRWLEPGGIAELKAALESEEKDVYYIRSLFFWDPVRVRTDFLVHNSPMFWRFSKHAFYGEDRNLETPEIVLEEAKRHGRVGNLRHRLMDFGYSSPSERAQVADRYFRAGKIDSLTEALLDNDPQLVYYDEIKDNLEIP